VTKNAVPKSWALEDFHEWPNGSLRSKPYPSPPFTLDAWTEITPAAITTASDNTCILGEFAIDHNIPGTIYLPNGPFVSGGGLYKTTNWGTDWTRIAACEPLFEGASDYLDNPLVVKLDPNNSSRLSITDGVRGSSLGLFTSVDGGLTCQRPACIATEAALAGIEEFIDAHHLAIDPTDFDHQLLTFHSGWGGDYGEDSGIMETFDFWETCTVHDPEEGWGHGHTIHFLYKPGVIGNASTWLLSNEGEGSYRTTNSGTSWTLVSANEIAHGASQAYYKADGTLFLATASNIIKSADNGANWVSAGVTGGWSIQGNGTKLYKGLTFSEGVVYSAPENDNDPWDEEDAQEFGTGPLCIQFDHSQKVLIGAFWNAGLWVKRVIA
jgi:hypothetical protein